MTKTKIIATIGPASQDVKILKKLILSGVDVVRLNFSHGNHSTHKKVIKDVRMLSKQLDKSIAILCDLQGPKLRIGKFGKDKVYLKEGQRFTFYLDEIIGDENGVTFKYPEIFLQIKEKDKILLNDGLLQMKVEKISPGEIRCKVLNSGEISSYKGVNIKGEINIPSLTEKDKQDVLFCIKQKVDWLSLSFVKNKKDIEELKEFILKNNSDIPVIAKIEKPQAIRNLDEILDICDAVMIARGDLGVEMLPYKVPYLQKIIIEKSHKKRKPVIVATQMLNSMIDNPYPTRAEVQDVASAVQEGADAVMLSGETAQGKYPVLAVQMMNKIIKKTESHFDYYEILKSKNPKKAHDITDAISYSAVEVAQDLDAKLIVAATSSGFTAKALSLYKPKQKVIAITYSVATQRRMPLLWGVIPCLVKKFNSTDDMLSIVEKIILEKKLVKKDDFVVIVGGTPPGVKGKTNFIKVIKV